MSRGSWLGETSFRQAFLVSWISSLPSYDAYWSADTFCLDAPDVGVTRSRVSTQKSDIILVGPVPVYCYWVFLPSMLFQLHFTLKPSYVCVYVGTVEPMWSDVKHQKPTNQPTSLTKALPGPGCVVVFFLLMLL